MNFEDFILKQLVRPDIVYEPVTRRFVHPTNDLSHPERHRAIYDEGHAQGLFDSEIRDARDEVVGQLPRYRDRHRPTAEVLRFGEHLTLGSMVRVQGSLPGGGAEADLLLMMVGKARFLVLESSRPDAFSVGAAYQLADRDYLSAVQSASATPFSFSRESLAPLQLSIRCLNMVRPSRQDRMLDARDAAADAARRADYTLHANPMALLMHDHSRQLPRYADVEPHQRVAPSAGLRRLTDLDELVATVATFVGGCQTPEEVERRYPLWLQYCRANGVSVMSLDELVNLSWRRHHP